MGNTEKEFKSPFVTNISNESEDYLVQDKLIALIRDKIVDFWEMVELMSQNSVETLKKFIPNLISSNGVKWKANVEGRTVNF